MAVSGQTVSITDALNHVLRYSYDPFGNLLTTTDAVGNVTTLSYDRRGRKVKMIDPDMGTWFYYYNALGELVRQKDAQRDAQKDARNQDTRMSYDLLGRMLTRNEPDLNSTWVYDTAAQGIGKLASASSDNGYRRSHSYDELGRLTQTSTVIDNAAPHVTSTRYDTVGRPWIQTYPTGYAVKNVYNPVGYLWKVVEHPSGKVLWTANTLDAQGHLLTQTYGNGVITQQEYYPDSGRLKRQLAGAGNAVQDTSYTYDLVGNLRIRNDIVNGLSEAFDYDDLNRVVRATANNATINGIVSSNATFDYDALGNISRALLLIAAITDNSSIATTDLQSCYKPACLILRIVTLA